MIVVLNKVDMFPPETREEQTKKMILRMQKTLANTKFANSPIVPVSAAPSADSNNSPKGVEGLLATLLDYMVVPKRDSSGPFIFSVDHCFPIKGQGTVMTGTVISGKVAVNQVKQFISHNPILF